MPSNLSNAAVLNTLSPGADWGMIQSPALQELPVHAPAIGLIELSLETQMAAEIRAFCPGPRTGIYANRVAFDGNATVEGLGKMEDHIGKATELLPSAEWLHVIVYGCTSGSVVIGSDRVEELISAVRPGVPVVTPISAVLTAIQAIAATKLAVVTPYVEDVNRRFAALMTEHGLTVTSGRAFGLEDGEAMLRMPPEAFLEAALEADSPDAEAIFISCTGIVVSPIIHDIEQQTGKPVITSNQAIAWQCREIAAVPESEEDIGALFKHRLPSANS